MLSPNKIADSGLIEPWIEVMEPESSNNKKALNFK